MLFYNEKIFKRCFGWSKKYWYKNLKHIPLYFRIMHHLIKYGYDEYAHWETFSWFMDTMKPILVHFRNNHTGYPIYGEDDGFEVQAKEYDAEIDKMISLLDDMDENNPKYETEEYHNDYKKMYDEMFAAKDEFFRLFAKHFYSLWD